MTRVEARLSVGQATLLQQNGNRSLSLKVCLRSMIEISGVNFLINISICTHHTPLQLLFSLWIIYINHRQSCTHFLRSVWYRFGYRRLSGLR